MASGTGGGASRPTTDTGRWTRRRVRSALSSWRTSLKATDVLVAGVVVALSLGLGAYLYARSQAAARFAFNERAQRLQAAVDEQLRKPSKDLVAVASFFQASDRVSRKDFRVFTAPMLFRPTFVHSLEWLPVVPDAERAALEEEARASGLTSYRFREIGPEGRARDSARRPFYVPIHDMEPPSSAALGVDVASDPGRWEIAERARDTGEPAASRPFRLIQDVVRAEVSPAVVVYTPVYTGEGDPGSVAARRAALRGFAVAIFHVAPLVNGAAAQADLAGELAFVLRDPEARGTPPLAVRPGDAAAIPRRPGFEITFPVRCADRRWDLHVCARPGALLPSKRAPIEATSAGTLAALLGLVAATSFRTIARLRRQAEKVGPYRLVSRLGHGAMGVVWEARHALLRRPTAVKLLAPGVEGERALTRFEREVQMTAGLTHPSTIAIYDYGRTADGVFYYAMELLRGLNLQQLVGADGPIPPGRAVHLLRQACGALTEAHGTGLIHRDIKPANLMVCVYGGIPDFLKILDFGLVKDVGSIGRAPGDPEEAEEADSGLSQDGSVLGTPLYMAPEGMSDPTRVDARADLFALGAVGYYLLTGVTPFPGRTAIEVFTAERRGPPPPPSRVGPRAVPASFEEVIRRCLSFRREERPASAEELDTMLEACADVPPWTREDAKAWWRDRGPDVLEAARMQRLAEETTAVRRSQVVILSSDSRLKS